MLLELIEDVCFLAHPARSFWNLIQFVLIPSLSIQDAHSFSWFRTFALWAHSGGRLLLLIYSDRRHSDLIQNVSFWNHSFRMYTLSNPSGRMYFELIQIVTIWVEFFRRLSAFWAHSDRMLVYFMHSGSPHLASFRKYIFWVHPGCMLREFTHPGSTLCCFIQAVRFSNWHRLYVFWTHSGCTLSELTQAV